MDTSFQPLSPSLIRFSERPCDPCGDRNGVPYPSAEFFGIDFEFVRCPGCGLICRNPMVTKESRRHIYESGEYWFSEDRPNAGQLNDFNFFNHHSASRRQVAS